MIKQFVRKNIFYLVLLLASQIFSGCVQYKIPTSSYAIAPTLEVSSQEALIYQEYQKDAASHWLYDFIPRHRSQIRWYDVGHWLAWALFGNDDHGIFSEAHLPLFKPTQPIGVNKAMGWLLRNPFHNFTYYVIGSAGCQNDEFTILKINRKQVVFMKYDPIAHTVFGGRYSSFYLGFHNGKPLISFRLAYGSKWKSDFYIGWRDRGNFGFKFLPLTKNSLAVWENLNYSD